LISAYLAAVQALLERFAATNFVADARLNSESQPGEQAYLSGVIVFIDGSDLHFSEFLDANEAVIQKLMYSYHYQDQNKQLILRYDNARHRPQLPYTEHKHSSDSIIQHSAPTLEIILEEILFTAGLV